MKLINIFLSDKIRLHPLKFIVGGQSIAAGPYTTLLRLKIAVLLNKIDSTLDSFKKG